MAIGFESLIAYLLCAIISAVVAYKLSDSKGFPKGLLSGLAFVISLSIPFSGILFCLVLAFMPKNKEEKAKTA